MTRHTPTFVTAGIVAALAAPLASVGASSPQSSNQAYVLIPERPSSVFVDATSTHVPQAPSLHATDSAFIDVDKDGDRDVVVSVG